MKMSAGVVVMVLVACATALQAQDANPAPRSGKAGSVPTVSIFELIDRVAKKSGKRFLVDPRVNVEVPLPGFDAGQLDYEALLAIFRLQQLATFTQDGVVNVIPDATARQMPTAVLARDDPASLADEFVTRVLKVENVCSSWLVPILRPLLPQAAHLAAHPPSNSLLMVDRAANVRRVAEVVRQLDRPPKQSCEEPKPGG
jgi:general secretion pathway protein D